MDNVLFHNFKLYFPTVSSKTVNYVETGPYELTVELNDGDFVLYDDTNNSIRRLPRDRNRMTERECQIEFSDRLFRIMNRNHMTQLELSEKTGIPQSSISNYINRKATPSLYNLDRIAKALGCSVDEFRYI